jgi:spore coat polysaccharide biosynthesis protein SpsF
MSKTVALVQARMSSSRFPGKVLEDLAGLPLIVFMVERVRHARTLDEVVVVTSTDASDDPLEQALARRRIACFRGDLHDVLARYAAAAAREQASEIVRLTGDCPLIDPSIVDQVVTARRQAGADYASNIDPPTYPDGLDVEVFTGAALARAHNEARLPSEREHVTPWMRTAAAGLRRVNCQAIADFSSLRLTVDYPDDLRAVRAVVAQLASAKISFDLFDVLRCLSLREDIRGMNTHQRNEGYLKSLATDAVSGANAPLAE